jgi:hypothetical protein
VQRRQEKPAAIGFNRWAWIGRYSRSRVCKLRGDPKISRRMIAWRKPDFDLSNVAISDLKSVPLARNRVLAATASTGALMLGGC